MLRIESIRLPTLFHSRAMGQKPIDALLFARGSEGAATLVSATYAASTAASRSKVTGFGSSLAASSKASAIEVTSLPILVTVFPCFNNE